MVVDGLDLTGSLERDGDRRREEEEDGDFFSTVLSMEMVGLALVPRAEVVCLVQKPSLRAVPIGISPKAFP
jgi:hypothetical protein